jgi:hypothetical protein
MREAAAKISDQVVRDATGRGWDEWFSGLDAAGAVRLRHSSIVGHLWRNHPDLPNAWRQSIAVAYERARGLHVVDETRRMTWPPDHPLPEETRRRVSR